MRHQVEGLRDAPPLLLLQGQANSHDWWSGVRPLLTDRFLTITFDYRGTGDTAYGQQQSEQDDEITWTTKLFARDAAAVLGALGLRSAMVYGTSMGGRIAQELAIARPDLVRALVLACTTPGGDLAHEHGRDVRLKLADPDPRRRLHAIFDLFYTPDWVAAHGGYERAPRHVLGDPTMTRDAARRHRLLSAGHDAGERLREITSPTLIIHARDDQMAPVDNAAIIHDLIPDSRLQLFDGRHAFFDEFPAVTRAVAGFLLSQSLQR